MSNPEDVVMLDDLDTFVTVLSQWHASKVAMLEHMLEIPEGTEVTFDGGNTEVLRADMLIGFKSGITLSLMALGELPFVTETVAEPTVESDLFTDGQ